MQTLSHHLHTTYNIQRSNYHHRDSRTRTRTVRTRLHHCLRVSQCGWFIPRCRSLHERFSSHLEKSFFSSPIFPHPFSPFHLPTFVDKNLRTQISHFRALFTTLQAQMISRSTLPCLPAYHSHPNELYKY